MWPRLVLGAGVLRGCGPSPGAQPPGGGKASHVPDLRGHDRRGEEPDAGDGSELGDPRIVVEEHPQLLVGGGDLPADEVEEAQIGPQALLRDGAEADRGQERPSRLPERVGHRGNDPLVGQEGVGLGLQPGGDSGQGDPGAGQPPGVADLRRGGPGLREPRRPPRSAPAPARRRIGTAPPAWTLRRDSRSSPAWSRAATCDLLRWRSTPMYTMTGPPSCRSCRADVTTSRSEHGSGGPLLHGIREVEAGRGRRDGRAERRRMAQDTCRMTHEMWHRPSP
jgi:hypothetical protein